jgi:stress response protein YsnF
MALLKLKDFEPDYKDTFGGYDIKGLDVYSDVNNEKIGSVEDLLVEGHFRYFILDLGFWGFGKKVLLPVGRAHIDNDGKQIHALGFTKEQVEHLPEFNESLRIDRDYEERVRGAYRPRDAAPVERPLEAHRPLEASRPAPPAASSSHQRPLDAPPAVPRSAHMPQQPPVPPQREPMPTRAMPLQGQPPMPPQSGYAAPGPSGDTAYQQNSMAAPPPVPPSPTPGQAGYYDPNDSYYQQDPYMYGMNQQSHSVLQRFEERLRDKKRQVHQPR